jgi:hypothetical protein
MRIGFLARAVLFCSAAALGLSQPITLGGYVIDGLTNQPLPGIRIHLYEWASTDPDRVGSHGPAAAPVTSDSEGHFAFPRQAAGDYVLQAELAHEVYTYGESVDPLQMRTIHVGPESEGQNLLFRILPRATLYGTVRDERGEIVKYASMAFYRRDRRGGRIELMFAGSAGLDDRGQYTIADLWPGDYAVCVEPPQMRPDYFASSGESEVEYHPGGESRVFTETCYSDPKSRSALLHLSSGARQKLDLTAISAESVTVRANLNFALLRADLPRLKPVSAAGTTDSVNERWRIPNVPPGTYIAYSISGDGSGFGGDPGSVVRQPVTVGSQPLVLELHPEKRGTVDVHLHGSDGRVLDADAATVWFFRFDDITLVDHFGLTGLAHTFDPGAYWLSIRPKPPLCATSQTLTGGTLVNGKLTVTPGMSARLDVELGSACGAIEVRAVSNGAPVPFANFLLLVTGTPEVPGDAITGSLDAHGRASIPRMSPGRYLLWAWLPNAEGYLGPDLAGAAARAVEVVVNAGQPALVSVDPIVSAGVSR